MNNGVNSTFPTDLQFPATVPTLTDLLDLHKKEIFLGMFCHGLATIVSFDPVAQTASATMNYSKTFVERQADGSYIGIQRPYPPLASCPVVFLGDQTSYMSFPVNPGDECLVLFNDRDIDNWFVNEGQVLNSSRLHSFSDAILLIGVRSKAKAIANFDMDRILLKKGNANIGVGKNNELVLIGNEQYTLNQLLAQLVSQVKSLVSQTASISVSGVITGGGVSGPPLNAAAIDAISSELTTTANQLGQLLE
jgi:hypothetical protein